MQKSKSAAAILLLLAILCGLFTYRATSYNPSTLVIDAKTVEKGAGRVYLLESGSNRSSAVNFQVGDSSGAASFYTIGLPAVRLGKLTIAPLARQGSFEINRITLHNDTVSYFWDEQGVCSQKFAVNGVMQRKPCAGGPAIEFAPDSSVIITAIPAVGVARTVSVRVALAILATLAFVISVMWLLRPIPEALLRGKVKAYIVRIVWLVFVMLYLYQFYFISANAVDIPFFEEWEYFRSNSLGNDFSWAWLFAFADYHRIVLTKLVIWLNLKLFSLDFAGQKIFNYLVYGCILLGIFRLKFKMIGENRFCFFPAFMIFLLSPIAFENHVVAFQLQVHIMLLCFIGALIHAYNEQKSLRATILFSILTVLTIYSYSAGLVIGVTLLLCRSIYLFAAGIIWQRTERKACLLDLLVSWAIILPCLLFWFTGRQKVGTLPQLILPNDSRFWDTLLNLISFGFGFRVEQIIPGLLCLSLVLFPAVKLLIKAETRWSVSTWQVVTAMLSILGGLAAISVGRGSFIGAAKTSRYAEIAFLLIPFAALAWWLLLKESPRKYLCLGIIWGVCFLSYLNDWSFAIYRDIRQIDTAILECVEKYAIGMGDGVCKETYYRPIGEYFQRAKQLDVHFTRQFESVAR
ncbi:MAG: hypothetical protein CVU66_02465 [Deltaproteobacteria bacterium HGW-Deltaproteobacteria-23]|nr:MAG: hypothetical protein CVU66_02465 [Deltaproteobacteria bacterium HGW-Deltaproteobacteria-23]